MALLDTYNVGTDGPWGNGEATHLARRAGFGGTPDEHASMVSDGSQAAFENAVDALVNFAAEDPALDYSQGIVEPTFGDPISDLPDAPIDEEDVLGEELAAVKHPLGWRQLQAHWLYRMRYTSQPLQEQWTLFLHDHLVSDYDTGRSSISGEVNRGNDGSNEDQRCDSGSLAPDDQRRDRWAAELVLNQNYLYRSSGLESFRDMLVAVTRDPLMLIYLDNVVNEAGRPQENYAREVLELFSMGEGNYNENDIREIAKCLTGETIPMAHMRWDDRCAADYSLEYGFLSEIHEPGNKYVFGSTIPEDLTGGETLSVIDLVMSKQSSKPEVSSLPAPYHDLPATSVYMAWKILTWFVNHDIALAPVPDAAVLELAHYMRGTDNAPYPNRRFPYDMRACLRKVLTSKYCFAPENRLVMHKTPVEFIISTLKGLGIDELYANRRGPSDYLEDMGMEIFRPPNVSGWKHGRAWTSSGSLIQRFKYARRVAYTLLDASTEYGRMVIDNFLAINGGTIQHYNDNVGITAMVSSRLLHDAMPTSEEQNMVAALDEIDSLTDPEDEQDAYYAKVNAAIFLAMTSTWFQLK